MVLISHLGKIGVKLTLAFFHSETVVFSQFLGCVLVSCLGRLEGMLQILGQLVLLEVFHRELFCINHSLIDDGPADLLFAGEPAARLEVSRCHKV